MDPLPPLRSAVQDGPLALIQPILRASAWGIAAIYAVFASLWIYFSDHALGALVSNPSHIVWWSVSKGFAFVAVTSGLLFLLVHLLVQAVQRALRAVRQHEADLERRQHLYAALSAINQAIVGSNTADDLFPQVTRALVDTGGLAAAWIDRFDPLTQSLHPLAPAGAPTPSAPRPATADADCASWDLAPDSWAGGAPRCAVAPDQAAAAFPIRRGGTVTAILNVVALHPPLLLPPDIQLLTKAAQDVSLALAKLELETAQREAQEHLISEQALTQTLIESVPGILYFYDRTGRFLRWNRTFETVSGYSSAEIATMTSGDFFAPEHRPLLQERIAEVFHQGESSVEAPFLTKDGRSIAYFFTGRRVTYRGTDCLAGIGIDISHRREAERALRDLNETLERKVHERTEQLHGAMQRAEAADRLKSAFLATMSHELRTPLNSIIGFTGIVLQGLAGPLTPEQSKQLGMVRTSARHLLELINDVLDISKIEAGQLEIHREPFSLPASCARVLDLVRPLAEKKNLPLRATISPALGSIASDRRRVEQILLNLLNNAIKFTEQGSVVLEADLSEDSRCVHIRIRDTGIGIQPHHLPDLFRPFHQIQSGIDRPHDGTGLGLAICRRLADLLGGSVTATSEWSQGSTFTLSLPLQCPAPHAIAHPPH